MVTITSKSPHPTSHNYHDPYTTDYMKKEEDIEQGTINVIPLPSLLYQLFNIEHIAVMAPPPMSSPTTCSNNSTCSRSVTPTATATANPALDALVHHETTNTNIPTMDTALPTITESSLQQSPRQSVSSSSSSANTNTSLSFDNNTNRKQMDDVVVVPTSSPDATAATVIPHTSHSKNKNKDSYIDNFTKHNIESNVTTNLSSKLKKRRRQRRRRLQQQRHITNTNNHNDNIVDVDNQNTEVITINDGKSTINSTLNDHNDTTTIKSKETMTRKPFFLRPLQRLLPSSSGSTVRHALQQQQIVTTTTRETRYKTDRRKSGITKLTHLHAIDNDDYIVDGNINVQHQNKITIPITITDDATTTTDRSDTCDWNNHSESLNQKQQDKQDIMVTNIHEELASMNKLWNEYSANISVLMTNQQQDEYKSIKLLLQKAHNEMKAMDQNIQNYNNSESTTIGMDMLIRNRTDTDSSTCTYSTTDSTNGGIIIETLSDLSITSHSALNENFLDNNSTGNNHDSSCNTDPQQVARDLLPCSFYIRKQDLQLSMLSSSSSSMSSISTNSVTSLNTSNMSLINNQQYFMHITSRVTLNSVLDCIVQYGYQLVAASSSEQVIQTNTNSTTVQFQPTRETQRLLLQHHVMSEPSLILVPNHVYTWIGTKNSLTSQNTVNSTTDIDTTGNDWPITKVQAIVQNTTPKELIEFIFDSKNVKLYNPISLGRDDIMIWHRSNTDIGTVDRNDDSNNNDDFVGTVKIVRGRVQPKLFPKIIETVSLMYVTTIPNCTSENINDSDNEHNPSYMLVCRSIIEDETWDTSTSSSNSSSNIVRSEMIFGVFLVRPINETNDCEFTTITHIVTSNGGIPEMIAKRMIPQTTTNMVRDIQRIFQNKAS